MKVLRVLAVAVALLLAGSCDDFTGPDQGVSIELLHIPWPSVRVGTTVQLAAIARPLGGGLPLDERVTWSSSNETVATVDSTGLVTARRIGTADITASVPGASAGFTLSVVGPPDRVTIVPAHVTTVVSGSFLLTATVYDASGSLLSDTVVWSSSDAAVVTVAGQGLQQAVVKVLAAGTATVTATADPASAGASVTGETVTFSRLSAGGNHTCGISSGHVYCWGNLAVHGATLIVHDTDVPVRITDTTLVDVTAGYGHACGLTPAGKAVCWGSNQFGALGREGWETHPAAVTTTATFATLATGFIHTCGLTAAGETYCWGDNSSGQLGGATSETCGGGKYSSPQPCSRAPVRATGLPPLVAVVTGALHTCGLEADGRIRCWGLGAAVTRDSVVRFQLITAGSEHACGVTTAGAAVCWGANDEGQLGDGTVVPRDTLTPVSGGIAFVSLSAGASHTCGLTADGEAYCWGANARGAVGDGTLERRLAPVAVAGGRTFVALTAGGLHTCGIDADGLTYCWGSNASGQLGVAGPDARTPVRVRGQP